MQGHDKNNAMYMNGSIGWSYSEIENKDGKREIISLKFRRSFH